MAGVGAPTTIGRVRSHRSENAFGFGPRFARKIDAAANSRSPSSGPDQVLAMKLGEHVRHVAADPLFRHSKRPGDLGGACAAGQRHQDVVLDVAEGVWCERLVVGRRGTGWPVAHRGLTMSAWPSRSSPGREHSPGPTLRVSAVGGDATPARAGRVRQIR